MKSGEDVCLSDLKRLSWILLCDESPFLYSSAILDKNFSMRPMGLGL
jgi:hypothetical protein